MLFTTVLIISVLQVTEIYQNTDVFNLLVLRGSFEETEYPYNVEKNALKTKSKLSKDFGIFLLFFHRVENGIKYVSEVKFIHLANSLFYFK